MSSGQVASEEDWCRRNHIKAKLSPATPSPGGGTSGGTAIGTYQARGLSDLPCLDGRVRQAAGRVQFQLWDGWLTGGGHFGHQLSLHV